MVDLVGTERGRASEFEESYEFPEVEGKQARLGGAIFEEPLSAVPRPTPVIVDATEPVGKVIAAMNDRHLGCALVVRDGRLAGIFTERDVLRRVAGATIDLVHTPVEDVMTRDPDTLPANASVAYAMREMCLEGYRHVPLVDAHYRPVGVVAVRDIIAWMVDLFPQDLLELPPAPGFPRDVDGA